MNISNKTCSTCLYECIVYDDDVVGGEYSRCSKGASKFSELHGQPCSPCIDYEVRPEGVAPSTAYPVPTFSFGTQEDDELFLNRPKEEVSVKTSAEVTWNESERILPYLYAGKATFTILSTKLDKRYTYKVKADMRNANRFFVHVMFGSDNEIDYKYLGLFYKDTMTLRTSAASTESGTSDVFRMMYHFLRILATEPILPPTCLFYPSGRCARCGRLLTTPESIERGLGPECWRLS